MSLRSPLGRVLGHGSAKGGTSHWWAQRLSAVALVPLTVWFAVALLGLDSLNYGVVRAWIEQPFNSVLLILLVGTILYHAHLGLQVVVEDYVHAHALKVATLIVLRFVHVLLAVAAIYSIVIISTGSPS